MLNEKKVIFLRHPDSELFEEAYFVMKRNAVKKPFPTDMVAEAERILSGGELFAPTAEKKERKARGAKRVKKVFCFLLAFLLGAGAAAAWFLLA